MSLGFNTVKWWYPTHHGALAWVVGGLLLTSEIRAQNATPNPVANATGQAALVLTIEGKVEVSRLGNVQWNPAATNTALAFGDRLRTGSRSRATVRLSDLSVLRVNETTVLEIHAQSTGSGSVLDLKSGSSYFLNRSAPASWQFRTPLISGAIRGTEFNLAVSANGSTTVSLLEGEVHLSGPNGGLILQSGEQGIVEPGLAPRKTAVLQAVNIIQWSLYYPAVIDLDELDIPPSVRSELADSLAAYRAGDLLAALDRYPENRVATSDSERVYAAALLLAVGQVDQTEGRLKSLQENSKFASPLRRLIAAVKHETIGTSETPDTASGWLAESYYRQSRSQLEEAVRAAHEAARKAPGFGFAWTRLAELEFSLGRTDRAQEALDRGLVLSPRNAQALALKGFVLAAQNRISEARKSFEQAISVDGGLANAWLGRGLCKIREGNREEGRKDLQVAAALEPNRADLRNYLGKAWDNAGDRKHAEKELGLAKQLDPADPTPWLYSALLAYNYNQDNKAIDDLEKSKELNNNRSVYRSRFLLDQDQAVRGANLAMIYRDAGMVDVSLREAASAVESDYANYSAHMFLANSYDALRDPKQVNLRYETPWFSQLLMAQLLAPVGAVSLSQNVSQQEYARLFDGDHVGFYSDTEYFSRGDWVQNASEYGNFGNTGFAFDQYYRTENGERPNNDLRDINLSIKLKQQLTPKGSIFIKADHSDYRSGDVRQYYDQRQASRTLRIEETQDANFFAGYHHEWRPGVHTLVLAGRIQDSFNQNDPNSSVLVTTKSLATGRITGVAQRPAVLSYASDLTAYSAEVQQVFQSESQTFVTGARYQAGDIDTHSFVRRLQPVDQRFSPNLTRASAYGYYTHRIVDPLTITVGLTYDALEYPENNELPPVASGETRQHRLSPKAGFRWVPVQNTTLRGVWTRSLGGVFYDTSVRLEPTEVAGFNQAFRSILPESVAGLVPGSKFESFGLALDQKFSTRTYLSIVGEILKSEGKRTVGTLDAFGPLLLDVPSGVRQSLAFQENSVTAVLNQLLGDEFAVGASYRFSEASLADRVPAVSPALSGFFSPSANRNVRATLQQVNLYAVFNHPSGFFTKGESVWSHQSNRGYAADLPGDDFWQFNAFLGFRFPRRTGEIQLALLNIGDRDYKLNPLNLYSELPRSRTLAVRLKFNF